MWKFVHFYSISEFYFVATQPEDKGMELKNDIYI